MALTNSLTHTHTHILYIWYIIGNVEGVQFLKEGKKQRRRNAKKKIDRNKDICWQRVGAAFKTDFVLLLLIKFTKHIQNF